MRPILTITKQNQLNATARGGFAQKSYKLKTSAPNQHSALKEIHMKKRSDKSSAISAVAGFAGVIDDAILPPAGVELRSDKEHLI